MTVKNKGNLMTVDLLDVMGSDLTVVNSARVSFDKASDWNYYKDHDDADAVKTYLKHKDVKLLKYLARNKHWSPFSHPQLQFRITAPVFVARQLAKHQVGLTWNEVSRRYVDKDPEFHKPMSFRKRSEDAKQGSSHEVVDNNESMCYLYEDAIRHCLDGYKHMISNGVCPEQARMILPQSMFTQWYWTGSLYAFARVCSLRLAEDTQQETRQIAEAIAQYCVEHFPKSWDALHNH